MKSWIRMNSSRWPKLVKRQRRTVHREQCFSKLDETSLVKNRELVEEVEDVRNALA